jgi:excisionase family DNA binding protein
MENNLILQGINVTQLADLLADSVLKKLRTERKDLQENTLLTVKEVCSLLKVSRQTIHAMRKDGRLKSVDIGRGIRFHSEEIEQLKHKK